MTPDYQKCAMETVHRWKIGLEIKIQETNMTNFGPESETRITIQTIVIDQKLSKGGYPLVLKHVLLPEGISHEIPFTTTIFLWIFL